MFLFVHKPYIPKDLKKEKGPFLMHISDTTEGIYKYIDKVIQEINPQYIVHTGDIVDNIKLETNADYLYLHQKGLSQFQDVIKKYRGNIYYALGNHDDRESVKNILNGGIIVGKELITIEGKVFSMSHKYEMLQKKSRLLFIWPFI